MAALKKILMVIPKRPLWSKNPKIYKMFETKREYYKPWYTPPLGLLTIAAVTPREIDLELVDEDFEEINFNGDYDLVAISCMTRQAYRAYEIADTFKKKGVPVVLGGIHASIAPEEALEHVDSAIIGEGEALWLQFLADFKNGHTKKVYKKSPDSFYDLKSAPVPRYELLKMEYLDKGDNFFNMIPIQVSRGCPHDCSFCLVSEIYGKRIRKKRIDQIVKEIETIKTLFGNRLIVFTDDNLLTDKKFAKELMRALIPLRIKWFTQTDISLADDDELLELAYASGCYMVLIGFESLNKSSLYNVNKNHWKVKQLMHYSSAVEKIQRNGIIVYAAFIVGFDNDDHSSFERIRNFMIDNHCTGQITILTPLPGTRLYKQFWEEKRLFKDSFWDECNFFDIVFQPKGMSVEEIEDGLIWLYDEVFNEQVFSKRYEYIKNTYKHLPSRWMS